MASNDSTSLITDEFGETDDWVEIHNRTSNTIDLSGYGFSDDYSLLYKWTFPSGILIPANGYLIVWTDDDDEQGQRTEHEERIAKNGDQQQHNIEQRADKQRMTMNENDAI